MSARYANQAAFLAAFFMPFGLACSGAEPARGEAGRSVDLEPPTMSLPPSEKKDLKESEVIRTFQPVNTWGLDPEELTAKRSEPKHEVQVAQRDVVAKASAKKELSVEKWSFECFGDSCAEEAAIETPQGFVTHWAGAVLKGAELRERDAAALAKRLSSNAGWELWHVSPGELIRSATKKGTEVYLLMTELEVSAPREAWLRYAVLGDMEVWLNGERVLAQSSKEHLLADHQRLKVSLRAGRNQLLLRLKAADKLGPSFYLRLRELHGAALEKAVWKLPPGLKNKETGCKDVRAQLTRRGTEVRATAKAQGLLSWPLASNVSLRSQGTLLAQAELTDWLQGAGLSASIGLEQPVEFWLDEHLCVTREAEATAHLAARYEALEARLAAVIERAPQDNASLSYLAHHARELLWGEAESTWTGKVRVERLELVLETLETYVTGLEAGQDPYASPGIHVRAYRSELDGSLQRYVVHVPRGYQAGEAKWPMVMLAHGLNYTPEDMLAIALEEPQRPGEAHRKSWAFRTKTTKATDAFFVATDGFRNAGSKAAGESDLLAVREEMVRRYALAPNRITLSGFSLGGSVAFWQALHHPTLFAGAGPLCGYPDLHLYRSVRRHKARTWEKRLLAEEGVIEYAESGRTLPLYMVHGEQDKPERSELIHKRYKDLGYKSELALLPLGHFIWDEAYANKSFVEWLKTQRLPEIVRNPRVRTGRYRWGRSHWLQVEGIRSRDRFGELDGLLREEQVQIKTENVSAFRLLGDSLGAYAARPLTLVVDGQSLGEVTIGDALALHQTDGRWLLGERVQATPMKRAGQEGPLYDIHYGGTLIVYGTQVPHDIHANQLAAEAHRQHAPWISVNHRVIADVAVTPEELRTHHVVLIGSPGSLSLWPQVEPSLKDAGFQVTPTEIVIGQRRFQGEGVGLSLIRPSPFGDGHYLVLHTGVSSEGVLSSRYLPEFTPDFLVYDEGLRATYRDRLLGERAALDGGFFTDHWTLESHWLTPH